MILDLTIITDLDRVNSLQTSCIICTVESNVQIAKNIDNRLTNTVDISTRCNITIVPNEIAISINFTYPDAIAGSIIRLCSQSRGDVKFAELIYRKTSIEEGISCLTIFFNPRNCDRSSTNNCLTKGSIDVIRTDGISSLQCEVQTCTINNNVSNLLRIVCRCKFSLKCKITRGINQCDECIIGIC
ncbi:hypothetical protein SBM1_00219 [Synechococcus phage S-BM1]|nr:hypothetical protein SBM1_00219 [Synechococcus phage S-BM1]